MSKIVNSNPEQIYRSLNIKKIHKKDGMEENLNKLEYINSVPITNTPQLHNNLNHSEALLNSVYLPSIILI